MKNILVTLSTFLIVLSVWGQETKSNDIRANEIGIELLGLANADFQLSYERALGKNISLGAGLGIKMNEGLVKLSGLDTEFITTNDITYSGFKVIPAVRYYLNNLEASGMTGFYFGAFVKIQRYNSDLLGTYTNSSNEMFTLDFEGNFNITSLGFMIGYKLEISNRLNLDFLIAGPGYARHKYDLKNRQPLPDEFYDDLNDALNEYSVLDFLGADFDFEGGSGETREAKFSLPAFRYGITLSYSF